MDERADTEHRLSYARVLSTLGDLEEAESEVAEVLDTRPDDLDALSLFAKIKHRRGELSQAVACWAQIHLRSPLNEAALMQIRAILHLALDPERGAGEFVALGQFQLVRKPVAQLEIEEAFGRFLARRPDEARARCEDIARKYKGKDREAFKLAVLASAWMAESSGDIEGACKTLEILGEERGFETDPDRVLGLVRLYERLGTIDRLEAAIHICQYLERRFEKISILARLAALCRRIGQDELASEYERRHLAAFRTRMHDPTFEEVARVAARRYLPLASLRTIPFRPPDERSLSAAASVRERAVANALVGDDTEARRLFAEGATLLDRRYLADLAALEGNPDDAVRLYAEAFRADPQDERVIAWLLDHHAATGSGGAAAPFSDTAAAGRAREKLEAAIRTSPLRPQPWRHLSTLLAMRRDTRDEAARLRARAEALEEARRRDASPIGRVLAAAVYHFVGGAKGLVHEVWAGREVSEKGRGGSLPANQVLGNLSPEMRQAVQNTFLSVREYARTKFPHLTADILDFNYTYKVTKEDEPSHGLSAGLPTALAFLSVFLQRPVPQDLASTGIVVADAHDVLTLRFIGDSEYKVKGAYNRGLRMIVLPLGNRGELEANVQVPKAVQQEIVRYASDLDGAVKLVFGEDLLAATLPQPISA